MIRCIKLRRCEKNTLRAFVDLEFELSGVKLVLRDCTLHEKDGQEWVAFSVRPYEGNDGATRGNR
jgi:hypothetical protein